MRVLHVVESLGGGVLSAVLAMVDATPEMEHHLAIWPRRSHADTGDERAVFTSVHSLPSHPARAVVGLRRTVRRLQPDHVHAHSSYAGLLARVVDPGTDVVYSPHCFAFERSDLCPTLRAAVRRTERSLVRRTAVLVACSPREAGLAAELGHQRIVIVPNRAVDDGHAVRAHYSDDVHVVTVGRVGPQKDWRYLLTVKGYLEEVLGRRVAWEWLGGGEAAAERELRTHGVTVAGWLPRSDVVRRLGLAQVYVHTAAWEAAPISILEASTVGLPIAARRLRTLDSLGVPGTEPTAADMAGRIIDLHDPDRWASEQQRSLTYAAAHSADLQRERLNTAYGHAPAALALR